MKSFIRSTVVSATIATLGLAATANSPQLDEAGRALLESLRRSPDSAGALIYRGAVFAQAAPGSAPLFSYERRVTSTAQRMASAHITRDPSGDVIIAEQAQFTPAYDLQRFIATNKQLGYSGSVELSQGGRHLEYRLNQNGKLTTASEDVADPVVAGPQLHGFILQHWDALAQGDSIPVRMIAMAKKTTYGFEVRRAAQADGRTSFSITPSSWLVRLAVAPLSVTFDTATKHVVRYEGRVPPMQVQAGKLKELDARVDYDRHAPVYR